jgi:hypothetical protein
MTTSANIRPRSTATATAAVVLGALVALAPGNGAQARPTHDGHPAESHSAHDVAHACFNTPRTWNMALDGPLPRCYTSVP